MSFVCRLCNEEFKENAAGGLPGVCFFCCKALIRRRQIAVDRDFQGPPSTADHHIPLRRSRARVVSASNG